MVSTLIVIPTYSERENLRCLLTELWRLPQRLHVLVVDDDSADGTREQLQQSVARGLPLTLLQRPGKSGLGTAYTLGLAYARRYGYDRVVQMDADGSHDSRKVTELMEACQAHDMAIGSRYVDAGRLDKNWPWYRRWLSTGANRLVGWMVGLRLADATGGFRCTRGELLQRLSLRQLLSRGFGWQWEFNRLVVAAGGRITEVPIHFRQRTRGQSKMSPHIMLESLWRLIQLRLSSPPTPTPGSFLRSRQYHGGGSIEGNVSTPSVQSGSFVNPSATTAAIQISDERTTVSDIDAATVPVPADVQVPAGNTPQHVSTSTLPLSPQTLVMGRRQVIRHLLLCLAALGWLGSNISTPSAIAGEQQNPGDMIARAYVDRATTYDPGTIVAILQNTQSQPLTIDKIAINGQELKEWPAATDLIAWHRLTRSTLAPGQTALLTAKLAQQTHGLIQLAVGSADQTSHRLLSIAEPEQVRVVALRYAPSGRHINLFLENTGSQPQIVREVRLDDRVIWSASNAPVEIPPDGVEAIRMPLTQTLTAGQRITLTIRLGDRIMGVTDRAIPGFRLSVEAGDQQMAQRINADPLVLDTYKFTQETTNHGGDAAPSLQERQGAHWSMIHISHGKFLSEQLSDLACVFACPTHSTDSFQTSAYLTMQAQLAAEQKPAWQTFLHCCRTQVLEGIAIFGQIPDAVRFNATLTTSVATTDPHRDKNPWLVYGMTCYTTRSASPSVAMPMILLEKDWKVFPYGAPLPIEARQMIYAAVAGGAGGISYRLRQDDWGKENREQLLNEVQLVDREIRQVRNLLAMGHPRSPSFVACDDPWIQAVCIDALPDGLVLVLINHQVERAPPELTPSLQVAEQRNVTLQFHLPDGFHLGDVRQVSADHMTPFQDVREQQEGVVTLRLPTVGPTALLVVHPASHSQGAQP